MKKTPIKSFEIIKEMYGYFVKKYRDLEPNLMICEQEDFDNVEIALKDYEKRLSLAKENQDVDKIAKRLLALEIIKDKVSIHWNEILQLWLRNKLISKEEYELLKEVLK